MDKVRYISDEIPLFLLTDNWLTVADKVVSI